jgi:hypothetical protein
MSFLIYLAFSPHMKTRHLLHTGFATFLNYSVDSKMILYDLL